LFLVSDIEDAVHTGLIEDVIPVRHLAIVMPDLRAGGAERVAVNLANSFTQRGYAVDMILLMSSGAFLADLLPEVRVVNLQTKRIRGALLPLLRYLIDARPTALIACMWPLTICALLASRLARVSTRVVVAEFTTWSRDEIASSSWGRFMVGTSMRYVFPSAYAIVTVSNGAANDLAHFANLERRAITVVYTPVVGDERPPFNTPFAPEGWWSGPHRRVLAVGTLKLIKDYSMLLIAFAKLCKVVNARLLIVGSGELRFALEAQARQIGIADNVFMAGFVEDPTPYYQHADLHVLSSTGEGLPTVIIEALAAGTPVVSTDCPSGPREILSDGKFGRLVPVGDAPAFAKAMEESLADIHDRSALKARAQDFSIDKAVDQFEILLFSNHASG
jgi:glycosyltransferase involved in cell wall biosynthesis